MTSQACFYGISVGPGDPELMSLKAYRLLQSVEVIAYLQTQDKGELKGRALAKNIASEALALRANPALEVAITMPMSRQRGGANAAYDQAAQQISAHLEAGRSVGFICEGDALFFGSFSYLLERLEQYPHQVIPGITSLQGSSAALATPLTMLDESLVVLSSLHDDDKILNSLEQHDSLIIMKAGRHRPRLLDLIKQAGRQADCQYIEYASQAKQQIFSSFTDIPHTAGPYFSLFMITRSQRDTHA